MAVYTDVSGDDLAAFVARYDIGSVLAFKGIAEGVENSNYLLHTESGYYILTLYEKRVDPGDLPFFLALMDHLSARGISCPTPLKTGAGDALGTLSDRPAAIVTFLEGMSVRKPKTEHCSLLGEALGRLHLAGLDFPMRRENDLSVSGWPALFDASRPRADDVEPGLADELATELRHIVEHWPTGLPRGVIHADLFPDNVFFLRSAVSGLIDFYFACTDMLAYDLAICLNAWCFEPDMSFNVTKAKALLSGYGRVRRLNQTEFDALPLLARGACLRFLLTRLNDWLDVPENALVTPKDPREYLRKLRFHRSVDSARAYGLEP